MLPTPELKLFARLSVQVATPQEVGATPQGLRRLIPITGGTVAGDGWSGDVLPGGADFQLIVNDELAELDARYTLRANTGELIYVENRALRAGPAELMRQIRQGQPVDPQRIYFRCWPRLQAGSGRFEWVNRRLFVGTGARHPGEVVMQFYEVL